jgi:hypothetical protein
MLFLSLDIHIFALPFEPNRNKSVCYRNRVHQSFAFLDIHALNPEEGKAYDRTQHRRCAGQLQRSPDAKVLAQR